MTKDTSKRNYTIFLSLVFIGIGSYKLYQNFILDQELPTYQWVLAAGLIVLGIYQLMNLFMVKK